ncbi:MAG: DUF4097 domain-containing protein [Lachnospiraceae bacterium]|jgi:hypothetical protein|nr:DUF4097 domain-containing protein [Lachnospiraceae bacterium]
MKKGWKRFWIACLIIIGIGVVLLGIGAVAGARPQEVADAIDNGWYWGPFMRGPSKYTSTEDKTYSFADVTELKLDLDAITCVVQSGNVDAVMVEATNFNSHYEISCDQDGAKLTVKTKISGDWLGRIHFFYNEEPTVTITVPDDTRYKTLNVDGSVGNYEINNISADKMKINVDAGELYITGISTDELDLEVSAGNVELQKGSASEKMKIEVGAGEVSAYDISTGALEVEVSLGRAVIDGYSVSEAKFSVGAGDLTGYGKATEKTKIDCNLGNVELVLNGKESDYDYSVDCGVGDVSVGDYTYSGLGNAKAVDNNGQYELDINCGAGTVKVEFE